MSQEEIILQQMKQQLKKTEKLVELEGFIKDAVIDEICDFYEDEIIESVEKYCKIGPGFIIVAEEVEKANAELDKYETRLKENGIGYYRKPKPENEVVLEDDWGNFIQSLDEESTIKEEKDILVNSQRLSLCIQDCLEWYLDQVARCMKERIDSKKTVFWEKWNLSRATKRMLFRLNAFEEKLIAIYIFTPKNKEETIKQIAELPEFACDPLLIKVAIDCIWKKLEIPGSAKEEFIEACEFYGYDCL